ncbi:MAG: hypothetical protein NG712_01215 [Omnitrophica bacterium]|nr:hypothetical protein [Candidatus Omnitrophota bacterium]
MFNLKYWLNLAIRPQAYIWIEATLIKETPKAILIMFDDKKIWLSKTRILRIKRKQRKHIVSIKISLWHWTEKL